MFYFSHDLSVTKSGTFPILKVPQKSILLKHYKFKKAIILSNFAFASLLHKNRLTKK